MKKRYFLGLPALMLALVLFGCPNNPEEEDTSSPVTSLSQMNGTWKGSFSNYTMTFKDFLGDQWNEELMNQMFVETKVTISVEEITSTINASLKTKKLSAKKMTMKFSGSGALEAYQMFKQSFEDDPESVFDESNNSITANINQDEEPISDEELEEWLSGKRKINQNGTKIKTPKDSMGTKHPEIIMVKQ